ncbi:MAG: hypothetical protein ACO3C4_01670 [Candidatus Limnocylindrus sp.]
MECPKCQSVRGRVIRSIAKRRETLRRRMCLSCGERWSTVELTAGVARLLKPEIARPVLESKPKPERRYRRTPDRLSNFDVIPMRSDWYDDPDLIGILPKREGE